MEGSMGHRKVWEKRRNHFGWEVHQTQRIIFQPCLSTGCEFLWLPVLCFSRKTRVVFSEFQTISLVASRLSSGWTPSETQLVGFPHGLPYPKQYKSLVGGDWNHGILNDFLYIGNFIIPTDELIIIFQRGRSTTNQIIMVHKKRPPPLTKPAVLLSLYRIPFFMWVKQS